MKKLLMGLAAIAATSFALPAFADDAKPAAEGDKPAKANKAKPKKGAEEKKPADAPAK